MNPDVSNTSIGRYPVMVRSSGATSETYVFSAIKNDEYSNGERMIEALRRVSPRDRRIQLVGENNGDAYFQVGDCSVKISCKKGELDELQITNCHPEHSSERRSFTRHVLEGVLG
ncbi:hypothetical protein GF386_06450 [Candidatus Pacearchaeota archaeon]|nr:hypothetical protein [Candidatus Pacearchaeota archaeon]MBD3283730.1 hypothetical protein [Candidatus Pacearchaeota archaeon]